MRLWDIKGIIYEPEGNTFHLHPIGRRRDHPDIILPPFCFFSLASLPPDFHSTTDPGDKTRTEIGTFGQKLEGASILLDFDTM